MKIIEAYKRDSLHKVNLTNIDKEKYDIEVKMADLVDNL